MNAELLRVLEKEKSNWKEREVYAVMHDILNKNLSYPDLVLEIGVSLLKSGSNLIQKDCRFLALMLDFRGWQNRLQFHRGHVLPMSQTWRPLQC